VGPIRFRGSGSQEIEFHVNATPEIAKRKKYERWVLGINQRIHATKVKGVVKLWGKSRKTFDLAKRGNFGNRKIIRGEE
jgi:hypothetical protein